MGLTDLFLTRRRSSLSAPTAVQCAASFRPSVEALEVRECLSLAVPTWLQVSALSSSQVKLWWNDVAGETGYRVLTWDGSKAIQIGQLGQDARTFTATNLQPDQAHWFSIEAFNSTTIARGAWTSIRTLPVSLVAPSNLQVIGTTSTQVNMQWEFSPGAAGYRIYRWEGTAAVLAGSVSAATNTYTAANLSAGTTYYFLVQAFDASGTASTGWVKAVTAPPPITAPTNLRATTVNASTIGLNWTDASGETGYRIYRTNGGSPGTPILIATLGANATFYQAGSLAAGTTYSFYVQAFNATTSASSTWAQATTSFALLQPPTQVVAQVTGAATVSLTWVEPARAVGYRLWVWTGSWTMAANVSAGVRQATITGLPSGRTTWFVVQAFTANFAEVVNSSAVSILL